MTALRVILASQSPRRRDLLTLIGIPHDVRPADIDETLLAGEGAAEHAERLARGKVAAIAASEPDALVIGSDTIVVVDGDVLGKPRDRNHAHEMLARLSGRTHAVMTAVAVGYQGHVASTVVHVDVTFKTLTAELIDAYIATGEPMDKAGAYGIQGYGATNIERVNGDYFAVMGLPLQKLIDLMSSLGIDYRFAAPTLRAVVPDTARDL